jgi:hypothetical protein
MSFEKRLDENLPFPQRRTQSFPPAFAIHFQLHKLSAFCKMASNPHLGVKRTFSFIDGGEMMQVGPSEIGVPRKKRELDRKKCRNCRNDKKKVQSNFINSNSIPRVTIIDYSNSVLRRKDHGQARNVRDVKNKNWLVLRTKLKAKRRRKGVHGSLRPHTPIIPRSLTL